VTRPPNSVLLGDGALLVPIDRDGVWVMERVPPTDPHYTSWLLHHQAPASVQPPGLGVELVVALLLPPIALLLAVGRFARDEVGPGFAVLLMGSIGAGLYMIALLALAGAQLNSSL
jgi:hypothetical protein